jgi:hypothetical protein
LVASAVSALFLAACAGDETTVPDPPLPPVEGCIDIIADGRLLPDAGEWEPNPWSMAEQPFFRSEHGLHLAWYQEDPWTNAVRLVVSSFDATTGEHAESRTYVPVPPEVTWGATALWRVAGAPDGSFAVLISHGDSSVPAGNVNKVLFGHVNEPELRAVVVAPWSVAVARAFHLGWDGEAFALHAASQTTLDVSFVRYDRYGVPLGPPIDVGRVGSIYPGDSYFWTDPESGTTWLASPGNDGVLLSGHLRDGTALPGTEATGSVLIQAQGGVTAAGEQPAIGTDGERALLGWFDTMGPEGQTDLQPLQHTTRIGDALRLPNTSWLTWPAARVITRWQGNWWTGEVVAADGVRQSLVSDSALLSQALLVINERCTDCLPGQGENLDARALGFATWEDELWFGFWDLSDSFIPSELHPVATMPYRIVRVKPGCSYITSFAIEQAARSN